MINEDYIMIATQGEVIGQINGLAVLDTGNYTFGKPSRITATTYVGKAGIINIEKEAEMSGNIHDKGMELIEQNKMTTDEIINFIKTKDIFYYDDIYYSNPNRNPDIFKYIQITSKCKNYKENITSLKANPDLFDLFKNSKEKRIKFYENFLFQIEKFVDMNIIFDIFSCHLTDPYFLELINKKIVELLSKTALYEENFENSFNVINHWIFCNANNSYILSSLEV